MIGWIRARVTYANVASTLALFIALGTGTAYAANEWTGANIVDQSLTAADLAVGTIGTLRVQDESLQAVDLKADSVGASEIASTAVGVDEIGPDAVRAEEIQTDAVGPTEISDNAIDSGEISDNSLFATDLAPDSVGASEIAANAVGASEIAGGGVGSSEIADNVITSADLAGGKSSGSISLPAGAVANGRCKDYDATVGGAVAGDAVIFSIDGAVPEGILIYGVRVPANGHATVKVCNFTGGAMAAFTNLPVSVITITL